MFERVLVANRGEIAVRIIRTLKRLGVESVAVFTDADRDSPHTRTADRAVALGESYLHAQRLVDAAVASGAQAVHPGYGFLSENAAFARACSEAGVVFIGPPADAIDLMGDKINAKRAVAAAGVPVVPGRDEPGLDDDQLIEAALAVGLPVLLKPSAGGGGKGMRRVERADELRAAIESARREAVGAFGDGTLLVERYVDQPRHIEMQVFADSHGRCVALGERECSLQRRHQKIVEEAPSPLLDAETRRAMGESAVAAARSCGYVGAGTVEFIVSADRPGEFFFMEMNTRLQVEHPVTEAVLGLDLVQLQLEVAAGSSLPWASQTEVPQASGHAVEARVYAEDPARGFLPSSGRVLLLREPRGAEGIRVDSGLAEGVEVGTTYDPMLSKVVAWGDTREEALRRLDAALGSTVILGLQTNVGFLRRLLADPDVRAGRLDTGLVERRVEGHPSPPDAALIAAARLYEVAGEIPGDPWACRDGWRVGGPAGRTIRWQIGSETVEVVLASGGATVGGRECGPWRTWLLEEALVAVEVGGAVTFVACAKDGAAVWVSTRGDSWRLRAVRTELSHGAGGATAGRVTSPMPGTVLEVDVEAGQAVEAGDRLVVVEAMKMEHTVRAPAAGTVSEVLVAAGQAVRLDQPLVVIEPVAG